MDSGLTLRSKNMLRIRLGGIEYPDAQSVAVVTFELFTADGNQRESVVAVRCEVALNGRGRTDYEQIVATAAERVASRLERAAHVLTKAHVAN